MASTSRGSGKLVISARGVSLSSYDRAQVISRWMPAFHPPQSTNCGALASSARPFTPLRYRKLVRSPRHASKWTSSSLQPSSPPNVPQQTLKHPSSARGRPSVSTVQGFGLGRTQPCLRILCPRSDQGALNKISPLCPHSPVRVGTPDRPVRF